MYISEDLQQELDFFKRTNEHFEIEIVWQTPHLSTLT